MNWNDSFGRLHPSTAKEGEAGYSRKIQDKDVSVIFNGTSTLGEALAIVIRYISGWKIKQLVRLSMPAKSLCGEVAREILSVLSTKLGIRGKNLLAVMRDHASVNNVAVSNLSIIYPTAMDIGCFPILSVMWERNSTFPLYIYLCSTGSRCSNTAISLDYNGVNKPAGL